MLPSLRVFLVLFSFFPVFIPVAKSNNSFQQEVHYEIQVRLDDRQHLLDGHISMRYRNHSPDSLQEIFMHLWPNAYKNNHTAFACQKRQMGSTRFHFAENNERGWIDSLSFSVNGQAAVWQTDLKHIDVARIQLPVPLLPGQEITIETPFRLKIPASFSRLGHVGSSYQMTQWYPKPAVYNQSGWHPMPYLDLGEFFSEFGSYDVTITLPANYVVAATGTLETLEEKEFLEEKVRQTTQLLKSGFSRNRDFPQSSNTFKTVRFKAEHVHDFAWFADKRFHVQKSAVDLPSGKRVETWAFYTNFEANLWKKATDYINRAVLFYSDAVGEYPWPHATAVQSALSAGGGMEYPMITVIGASGSDKSLDEVITHEVGHNWFYGILASNERDWAWMDEGINTFYDNKYLEKFYPTDTETNLPSFLVQGSGLNLSETAYLYQASRHNDQAPQQNASLFNNINYFISAYIKPAQALKLLEKYTGEQRFETVMKAYFQQWKFRHPSPKDFQQIWEDSLHKNLSWLFEGMLQSDKKVDYAIRKVSPQADSIRIYLKNKGQIEAPFPLLIENKQGEVEKEIWIEGFSNRHILVVPGMQSFYRTRIDKDNLLWDINRKNNQSNLSGLFHRRHFPRFKLLAGLDNQEKPNIYWSPLFAWNKHDDLMLGVALYNRLFFAKKIEFGLLPFYSFTTKKLIGTGEGKINFFPDDQLLHRITVGLGIRSFHTNRYNFDTEENPVFSRFQRIAPSLEFAFQKAAIAPTQHSILLSGVRLNQQVPSYSIEGAYEGMAKQNSTIYRLGYFLEKKAALHPASLSLQTEYQRFDLQEATIRYIKLTLEASQRITYRQGKNIGIRFFAGLMRTSPANLTSPLPQAFSLTRQGFNDYAFDGYFLGRTETSGIWSRQIQIQEGGFKQAFGPAYREQIGQSNEALIALNVDADLSKRAWSKLLPLKPYFDVAFYAPAGKNIEVNWLWSGGIKLEYLKGALGFYLPLVNANSIETIYKEIEKTRNLGFLSRISFSLDLGKLHPWTLMDQIRF